MHLRAETFTSERAWHDYRAKSLGSSEAPALVGVSGFESPFSLWAIKTGRLEPAPATVRMAVGHALEPTVAELVAKREGLELYDPGHFTIYRDDEVPWRHATPDRLYRRDGTFPWTAEMDPKVALETAHGVLELKTVSAFAKRHWDEDGGEPSYYALIQVQHQLLVTGMEHGIVAALFGLGEEDDVRVYHVERHPGLIEALDRVEREFWAHVEDGTPPDPDASERTAQALAAVYPRARLEPIPLDPELGQWIEQRKAALAVKKEVEEQVREAENHLKAALGEHEAGEVPGVGLVTWRDVERKSYTVEAKTYRRFGVKTLEGKA